MTEAQAQQFVAAQHEKIQFSDAELEFIFSELQLHPLKLQILCDWVIKNRQRQLSEWVLAEEITKEFANFFVGSFDSRQFLRLKKIVSLETIKKVLEAIKTGRDTISGS